MNYDDELKDMLAKRDEWSRKELMACIQIIEFLLAHPTIPDYTKNKIANTIARTKSRL